VLWNFQIWVAKYSGDGEKFLFELCPGLPTRETSEFLEGPLIMVLLFYEK